MLSDSLKKLHNKEKDIALMGIVIVFLMVGVTGISTMGVSSRESFMVQDTPLNLTTFNGQENSLWQVGTVYAYKGGHVR